VKLDLVHDIQAVYRKTLNSMSRPGLISNIRKQADQVDLEAGCFPATLIMMLMLLDTEVTFQVYAGDAGETAKLINQLTYATTAPAERADFIFVLHTAQGGDLEQALKAAYPGDLLDPHQAATIIIETPSLTNEQDWILTGPGIEKESYVKVETKGNWVQLRAKKNGEYPLGVELIFTDPRGNILCLPRTTRITKKVVGSWDM